MDWTYKNIEEISKVVNGYSFKSKDFSPDNEIKSIKITNVGIMEFVEDSANNLPSIFLRENAKVRVHEGDIVLALTRTIISGGLKVARVPKSYNNSLLNQRVAAIIPNPDFVDSDYLYYYFSSDIVYNYVLDNVNTLMQPNLSIGDLKKMNVPIFSIPEQQQIVALLDQAFGAIDQAKANIEKNIENAKELFQSKLNDIFSQKNEGWEEKTLSEVCTKTTNIKWQEHKGEEFQYVDLSSVSRETLEVTETVIVNDENAPSRAKKNIEKGDVIFATTRPTLKRATIIREELDGQICSTGYVVLRPNEQISTDWIFFYLLTSTFMDRMETLQRGASYPAVSDKDVKSSVLSIPTSNSTEKEYIVIMRQLREGTNGLILQYKEKLDSIEELKKSILQKAFAGELTIDTVAV